MDFWDLALTVVGAVAASDLAQEYAPDVIDFAGLPVRKYAGAIAGGYLVHTYALGKKLSKAAG